MSVTKTRKVSTQPQSAAKAATRYSNNDGSEVEKIDTTNSVLIKDEPDSGGKNKDGYQNNDDDNNKNFVSNQLFITNAIELQESVEEEAATTPQSLDIYKKNQNQEDQDQSQNQEDFDEFT